MNWQRTTSSSMCQNRKVVGSIERFFKSQVGSEIVVQLQNYRHVQDYIGTSIVSDWEIARNRDIVEICASTIVAAPMQARRNTRVIIVVELAMLRSKKIRTRVSCFACISHSRHAARHRLQPACMYIFSSSSWQLMCVLFISLYKEAMSVSSAIAQSIAFVETAGYMPAACANQGESLIKVIEHNRGGSNIEDSTKALALLKSIRGSKAFPKDIRDALIDKIVNMGSEASESTVGLAGVTIKAQQEHAHIEHYLTEEDWAEIARFHAGNLKITQLVRRLAIRACAIRLWNPKETVGARIAAIIATNMDPAPCGSELYEWARLFKQSLVDRRKKHRRNNDCGPAVYASDATMFAALNPGVYDAERPPVPSKIDKERLEVTLSFTSCRRTNLRSGRASSNDAIMPIAHRESPLDNRSDIASQSIRMIMEMMRQSQSPPQQQTSDPLHIDFCTPQPKRTRSDGRFLALENGSNGSDSQNIGGAAGIDEEIDDIIDDCDGEPDIDTMLKQTQIVMTKAQESKKKKNNKKEKKSNENKKEKGSKASSVAKRPASSDAKKPAIATIIECKSKPAMPSLTESGISMMWKGCKIQSNPNNRKWRVFPKPDKYLYDKSFPWGDNPRLVWESLLAYCNNPILPAGTKPRK